MNCKPHKRGLTMTNNTRKNDKRLRMTIFQSDHTSTAGDPGAMSFGTSSTRISIPFFYDNLFGNL
jgi:hypothetical protein